MATPSSVSKVYWSSDVTIDPNIFFGTPQVRRSSSLWGRAQNFRRTSSRDLLTARSRTPSVGSKSSGLFKKWHNVVGSTTSINAERQGRRGTILAEKVTEEARLSRENSFDSREPTPRGRRFSSLVRAGQAVTSLIFSKKEKVDLSDLNAVDKFKL